MRFLVLVSLLVASPAAADPAAEALFREGRELVKAGRLPEACDRFARSLAIEPKVGTALNLGDCREHQGQLADAWEAFVAAHALASRDGDDRGPEADSRAAALAPKLAHLRIVVAAPRPAGLTVTRDAKPIANEALDTELPVDPGTHDITARAPGYLPASVRVQLALGAHETATLPALEVDPNAPRLVVAEHGITPPLSHLAFGAAFGGTSDADIVGGLRIVAGYPAPYGAIRATLQALYTTQTPTDNDLYHHIYVVSVGLGFDYLWAWGRGLASTAGFGVGRSFIDDSYGSLQDTTWGALRASPLIVRLASPRLEIGLHLTYVVNTYVVADKVLVGVLGVDWYVW